MIYLDYAANTPVDEAVLNTFVETSTNYIANPNSSHRLGRQAKEELDLATEHIAKLVNVKPSEIIYTSGATESNNLAIKGIANEYRKNGKHIITTFLEHSSVTGAFTALQNDGYEVDFVDISRDGHVDLDHLKELLRTDTILVSICYVDSEIGIMQDVEKIANLIANYPNCYFHVDATQAIGKIPVCFDNIDLITFSPHKFYGLNGCGILIRKENVLIQPLIHGGISTTTFRSGTPMLAFATSTDKALTLALDDLDNKYKHVKQLNDKLRTSLSKYPKVSINSTNNSIPYILNISVKGVRGELFQDELEKLDIFISTKSACCHTNTASKPVYALTKDRKLAMSTLRISVGYMTTMEDIEGFLLGFDDCYKNLVK
jgi:cysteine desulfurase